VSDHVAALASALSREAGETLIRVASSTPPDRLEWKPLDNGRTILDQLVECCIANRKWARILRNRTYSNLPREQVVATYAGLDSLEVIAARLRETVRELVEGIETVSDEDAGKKLDTEWGPYTLGRCCIHAYWNMVYHEGQINYVQTLYGDFEEHN
jgi:uncharacterized damage-inducible protein DinB